VTHRLTAIVDYDRILVMTEGQLVEQGSHDDRLGQSHVYATLWADRVLVLS
jgi:ABC-type multidrug transport system fused ATPase/permease subunit